MPPSLAASITKVVGHTTSGNGYSPHTPLCIPSSHCQMRSHHHKETPAEHTPGHCGDIFINRCHSPTEESLPRGKKMKTQVTKQQELLLNLLSPFWLSLACWTGLLGMHNDHLEPASLRAHPPLVYLHFTTATYSASCYTKHKNKQIIQ